VTGSRARARDTRTVRIGITGPIGCGKSQVVRWLADLGVAVVDADREARAVTSPGHPVHAAILARFGDPVRAADGTLDRAELARLVFGDPDALAALESIVHPAVRPRIMAAMETAETAGAPAVAVEAIKLVEGGLADLCDEVWLVTCDPGVQRARLLARGMPVADAGRRMAAQAGLAQRLSPRATRVLETSGSPEATRAQVVAALGEVLASRRGGDPSR
jgi:dephospho-CoA kinase